MQDFAAIDFETANNERSSVCSVGVVIVRGGKIEKKFYSLIKPEPEYYNYWCSRVHGLCITDTDDAPIFPEVWQQIQPLIEELPLVAHNKAFDENLKTSFSAFYEAKEKKHQEIEKQLEEESKKRVDVRFIRSS